MPTISDGELFQNAVYVGLNLQDIMYGIQLVLYFKTMRSLLGPRRRRKKTDIYYAVFSSVMMFLITIWIATQAVFSQKMWLYGTNYPGGLNAYWADNFSIWYMNLGTASITILQQMTDALMVYRCWMIWNNYYIIIVPSFLWVATLVLGIVVIRNSSIPGGNFFSGVSAQLGLAYYSVSIFLTALLTWMICYRMVLHGRRIREDLGREYASPYYAVIALVVESVLPHTLTGIAFLVSFGVGSQTSIGFACVYILMMCISPQMLILRVATGRAWTNDEGPAGKPPPSTIQFSPREDVPPVFEPNRPNPEVLHLQIFESAPKGDEKV